MAWLLTQRKSYQIHSAMRLSGACGLFFFLQRATIGPWGAGDIGSANPYFSDPERHSPVGRDSWRSGLGLGVIVF